MASGRREAGFTYLVLLLAVAVIGIGLAGLGQAWSTAAQREREQELLFVGDQFRRAVRSYVLASPGAQRYPQRLEELLEDKRFASVRRHLRRIYRDPMTGTRDWGLVEAPGGGIMGVYSRSEGKALKTAGFAEADRDLEGQTRYADWKFVFRPASLTATRAPGTSRTR